jgi:hypothetical protein
MSKRIDLDGQKFGKLTVIKYDHTEKPRGTAIFLCSCECGNIVPVASGHLRSGHTQSCGCYHQEQAAISSTNNTWGRKHKNPQIISAKHIWERSYSDGCSFETFMILSQKPCYYCGILPSNTFNKYLTKRGTLTNTKVKEVWAEQAYFTYNGLDRIDPSKDHSEDNVVPCCFRCNRAKDDMTAEEFKVWLQRLTNHFLK